MKSFNTSVRQQDKLLLLHRQGLWAARPESYTGSWIIIEARSGLLHYPHPYCHPIIIESRSRLVQIV